MSGGAPVKAGAAEMRNFDPYRWLRVYRLPKVGCGVRPAGGFLGGVGEPAIAGGAPAVLNAIFAATGKGMRGLPLKHHSLKA